MKIEGIPDGWELVAFREASEGEYFIDSKGEIQKWTLGRKSCVKVAIIRKIEKPKQYRPFANAAEYVANRREGSAVDWKVTNNPAPGFFAVVSANETFVWVAFGTVTERFDWERAFEKLQFRHVDNSTSPFGIEVTE